jgi:hypothetical protein
MISELMMEILARRAMIKELEDEIDELIESETAGIKSMTVYYNKEVSDE